MRQATSAGPNEIFFEARLDGRSVVTAGAEDAFIGHQLPTPDTISTGPLLLAI
jgi:hypothetical protein